MNNGIQIGEPLSYGGLAVFPLFRQSHGVKYQLADEGMAAASIVVVEIDEAGSVPELTVENRGEIRVLFLEGEELVVAVRGKVTALDVFDQARTCRNAWSKLLTGFAIDAMQANQEASQPDGASVERFVRYVNSAPWTQVSPVGEGEAYRVKIDSRTYGAKLTLYGSIVHASLLQT